MPCQLFPRCGPAGSCPHSWEEEVGPGPQSTPEGPLPLVLSPAAGGYQALLALLGSSALVQSPGRGYLPPKTTRIPLPGAETPSCSLEPPSALGSPGNPALPSPLAPSFLCPSPSSLRDS
ncbi:unnamed protein product [Rangifer tarandus platyrhynchus]|uniref:Uncharacterized protein n=2 Tax=Rangifer tarandus platyrhynchus TaxID=3082113 RepID=A0ABN8ZRE1_RANTA|nr:unnamed protein product [Rangifer tarandus platyrhynchus]